MFRYSKVSLIAKIYLLFFLALSGLKCLQGQYSFPAFTEFALTTAVPTMHIHQRAPIDVEAKLASLTLSEKISLLSGAYLDHLRFSPPTHTLQAPTSGTPWPSHPTTSPR